MTKRSIAEEFEDDAQETSKAADSQLGYLTDLCTNLDEKTRDLEALRASVKALEDEVKELSERTIPDTMMEIGLTELKLANGGRITLKQEVYASITEKNKAEAFAWLRERHMDDLIKNEFKVVFSRGEDQDAAAFAASLDAVRRDFNQRTFVHPQTLKATIASLLRQGVDVPEETFSVHRINRAVIS